MMRTLMTSVGLALVLVLATSLASATVDPAFLAESQPEVLWNDPDELDLRSQAMSLGTPVRIYEWARNETEFIPYHGARSSSVNAFLGRRGNDVDLASMLIAMLRSQRIPARYAKGLVRIPADRATNWLGVQDLALAAAILDDQGIQSVRIAQDQSYLELEHVWVQALVALEGYRGAGEAALIDCAPEPPQCAWVDLDPSFKQRVEKDLGSTVDISGAVAFDYGAYYHALDTTYTFPDSIDRTDKNPLAIYKEQILDYLRNSHPGKTLRDVPIFGPVVPVRHAILPGSLPYAVVAGSMSTYASVSDHDGTLGVKVWQKMLTASATAYGQLPGGGPCTLGVLTTVSLADLSTKRLTVTVFEDVDSNQIMSFRLGGVISGNSIQLSGGIDCVDIGTPMSIQLQLDGPPDTTGIESDTVYDVSYPGLVVGGYYLIATGGETSNWSQVHRASRGLLRANEDYPLITNGVGTVFVDENGDGGVDAGDTPLLNHYEAQDELTGGLLHVAQGLYYAKLRDAAKELGELNRVVTPIGGFVGVISTVHEVELLDGTAFSVLPGGLLIDMKGIQINGNWEIDAPATYSNSQFELLGTVGSALEHEIWQELTGYDALSTTSGIQKAIGFGHDLLELKKTPTEDTMAPAYPELGFSDDDPLGALTRHSPMFGHTYITWHAFSGTIEFDIIKESIDLSTPEIYWSWLTYRAEEEDETINTLHEWVDLVDDLENQMLSAGVFTWDDPWCGGTPHCGGNTCNESNALAQLEYCFDEIVDTGFGATSFLEYLDENNEFDTASGFAYREVPRSDLDEHSTSFVRARRNEIYLTDGSFRFETLVPNRKTSGSFPAGGSFRFQVYLSRLLDGSGEVGSLGFKIVNDYFGAGGGYVNGEAALTLSNGAVFDNEVMNDKILVAITNNDPIRTPSTADPISTVTGNMYLDETDLTIKNRGIPYAFTRTYNSGPSESAETGRPMGHGWSHSYNMRLRSNDFGAEPNVDVDDGVVSSISYVDERGGESNFLVSGAGPMTGWSVSQPRGVFFALNLLQAALPSPTYIIRFRNGVEYEFGGADLSSPGVEARLEAIRDPYGNELTLGYDGSNRLTSIVDNLGIPGRTGLELSYYAAPPRDGLLASVQDWDGREWGYAYDDEANLVAYTNPMGDTTEYSYVPEPVTVLQLFVGVLGLWALRRRDSLEGRGRSGLVVGSGVAVVVAAIGVAPTTANANPAGPARHELHGVRMPEDRNGDGQGDVNVFYTYYRNGKGFENFNSFGEGETVDYDLYRKSTRVTDARGFVRTHHYDASGQLVKLEEPDGGVLLFDHTSEGLRYRKRDGLGYATTYSYCTAGDLNGCPSDTGGSVTVEQNALGHSVLMEYGIFDQVTRITDRRGNIREFSYYDVSDGNGKVRGKLESEFAYLNGQKKTLSTSTYYPDGNLKRRVNFMDPNDQGPASRQRVTDYFYDVDGLNMVRVEISGYGIPATIARDFAYDARGRLETETLYRRESPTVETLMPLTISYAYDDLDRRTRVTDTEGNYRETVYDRNGNVVEEIESFGRVITLMKNTYDSADRLVRSEDVYGEETLYAYDEVGNVVGVTDPNGSTTRFEYDEMGRRTAVIDANGHRSERAYNLAGDVISTTDATGHTVVFERDPVGRVASTADPLGYVTKFEFDENGNQTSVTDANAVAWLENDFTLGAQPVNVDGVSVFNAYDELNRLVSSRDAEDGLTIFEYDLMGNQTKITDAEGAETQFEYDAIGRLIRTIDPVVESPVDFQETFVYDEADNLIEFHNRLGQVAQVTYDALNRRVQVDYLADGTVDQFVYDIYGNLERVSNESVTYRYTYDFAHRKTSKTDERFKAWNRIDYLEFDAAGNLTRKRGYRGDETRFQFDATNRVVSMTNDASLQVSYHYDPAGRLLNRILSNGTQTDYNYDAAGRLASLTQLTAIGGVIASESYQRDRLGNILVETDSASESITYSYDGTYRLLGAAYSAEATADITYSYDAVGNRLSMNDGTVWTYSYSSSGNRLGTVSRGGAVESRYEYDPAGNTRAVRGEAGELVALYGFNQKGELDSSTIWVDEVQKKGKYRYDPLGHRIEKVDENGTLRYLLQGEHTELIVDEGNRLVSQYLRGVVIDEVVSALNQTENGEESASVLHHDDIGSVTEETSHAGELVAKLQYGPFGESAFVAASTSNSLRFTGREFDFDTGLYYYRARFYDPRVGRFLSEDPLGFEAGINFYSYVGNNPVRFRDPYGRTQQHPEHLGSERLGAEFGDIFYGELNLGYQIGFEVRVDTVPLGFKLDGGSVHFPATLNGLQTPYISSGSELTAGITHGSGATAPLSPENLARIDAAGYDSLSPMVDMHVEMLRILDEQPSSLSAGYGVMSFDGDLTAEAGFYGPVGGTIGVNFSEAFDFATVGLGMVFDAIAPPIEDALGLPPGSFLSVGGMGASGGFVLYPNKSNLSMATRAYQK